MGGGTGHRCGNGTWRRRLDPRRGCDLAPVWPSLRVKEDTDARVFSKEIVLKAVRFGEVSRESLDGP